MKDEHLSPGSNDRTPLSTQATLNRDSEGQPVGVAAYLHSELLHQLAIDLDGVERIEIRVIDDQLSVSPVGGVE